MKRKFYDSPTTLVIQLEHQARLLNGSDIDAVRNGYGDAVTDTWGGNES